MNKTLRTKIHQACFAVIVIAVAIMAMTSCVSEPQAQPKERTLPEPKILRPEPERIGGKPPVPQAPTPFQLGEEVQPPYGCLDLRARKGEC